MIRILITYLLPLVLPAIAWYVWRRLMPAKATVAEQATGWAAAPWDKIGIAGVVFLVATLGSIAIFTGAEPGNFYTPARVVDGKVVPGDQAGPAQPPAASGN